MNSIAIVVGVVVGAIAVFGGVWKFVSVIVRAIDAVNANTKAVRKQNKMLVRHEDRIDDHETRISRMERTH